MIYRSCPAVALAKEESSRSYAKGKMSEKLEVENYSLTTSSDYVFLFVASWLRGFVASWLRGFVASCENLSFREGMVLSISGCCESPPAYYKRVYYYKRVCPFIIVLLLSVPLLSLAPCMGRGFFWEGYRLPSPLDWAQG